MLIVTPSRLESAAERAFFAELAGWDTGSAVRGAVMVSLPIVEPPLQRRQSDAVLFVPEGLAVVRVVEVERQSGVVTAGPEGPWTIGDGDGPGSVLQLGGGGSTPLDGLMRAGMHAAVTLRQAGLEPGRIARLTVLTGAVTGLVPADGDLGEGDQVAVLDPRSLLLGVARASRHAGTDNPRLWTTADVRAAIEALGVPGRTPSVEELNGEGFPYSPYVLRRPDLLTPAALNASPSRVAAGPATGNGVARVAPPGPLVDPAAAARVAAAAVAAQQAEEPPPPARDEPAAEAVAVEPAAEPAREAVAEEPAVAPHPAPEAPRVDQTQEAVVHADLRPATSGDTVSLRSDPEPRETPAEDERDDTGGLDGLFGGGAPPPAGSGPATAVQPPVSGPSTGSRSTTAYPFGPGSVGSPPSGQRPDAAARELPPGLRPRRSPQGGGATATGDAPRSRRAVLVVVALALVLLAGVLGVVVLTSGGEDARTADPAGATTDASPPVDDGPQPGDTELIDGVTYTLQVRQRDTSCADHAYGSVASFFAQNECTGLARSLWSAEAEGGTAVVSVAEVTMPAESLAEALRALADTDGSGNVSDLLREGVGYPGAPARLQGAQYASSQRGEEVTIVESAWAGQAGSGAVLDVLASSALALPASGG
ncbi:hypothetical protein [Modestobacter roseus]|uniref:hypothetical protein n=1 Tax=Modestobacter roseus TaxID=1181884 RepID=UPI0034DFEDA5